MSCIAPGFRAAGVACGLKAEGRRDLALLVSDTPASAAGMFTTNCICGAPVERSRIHIADGIARAVVVNAGNANVCTGERGDRDALSMCAQVATETGIPVGQVLVASTGVIGRYLPMDRILPGIAEAVGALSESGGDIAAEAVLTTDLVKKTSSRKVRVGNQTFSVHGFCKGSGMIAPKLGTMLAFLTTDASVAASDLNDALREAVNASFNRVTVDGDTSTSDMALLLANGAAGGEQLERGTEGFTAFQTALLEVCTDLAKAIASDGEGATKFFTVHVTGAATKPDAEQVARTIAESPLVKTAVFGGDPNWGRIAAAAGRAGVSFDARSLRVWVDDMLLFNDGMPTDFILADAEKLFQQKVLLIRVDLGEGDEEAEVYTCDLTYDYIKINAEYTT